MGISVFIKSAGAATKAFAKSPAGKALAKKAAVRFGITSASTFVASYARSALDGYIYGDDSYHLRDKIGGVGAHLHGAIGVEGVVGFGEDHLVNHRLNCIFENAGEYTKWQKRRINAKSAAVFTLVYSPANLIHSVSRTAVKSGELSKFQRVSVMALSWSAQLANYLPVHYRTRRRVNKVVSNLFGNIHDLNSAEFIPYDGSWRYAEGVNQTDDFFEDEEQLQELRDILAGRK